MLFAHNRAKILLSCKANWKNKIKSFSSFLLLCCLAPTPTPTPPQGKGIWGANDFSIVHIFLHNLNLCVCVCVYLCVCARECIFFPPFLCILNNTSWLAIPSQGLWCHSNLSAGWVASNMVQASCFAIYNVYLPLPLRIKLWSFVDRVCTNFSSVLWRRR